MPNESDFVYQLVKYYNTFQHSYFHRTHGGIYSSNAGMPDILGCWGGKFVGIECKVLKMPKRDSTIIHFKKHLTDKQLYTLNKINNANGLARIAFLISDIGYIMWFDTETIEITAEMKAIVLANHIKKTSDLQPNFVLPQLNSYKLLKKLAKKDINFPS